MFRLDGDDEATITANDSTLWLLHTCSRYSVHWLLRTCSRFAVLAMKRVSPFEELRHSTYSGAVTWPLRWVRPNCCMACCALRKFQSEDTRVYVLPQQVLLTPSVLCGTLNPVLALNLSPSPSLSSVALTP